MKIILPPHPSTGKLAFRDVRVTDTRNMSSHVTRAYTKTDSDALELVKRTYHRPFWSVNIRKHPIPYAKMKGRT